MGNIKPTLLLIALAFTAGGCANTQVFELASSKPWERYESGCGTPTDSFERTIAEGVAIGLSPFRRANATSLSLWVYLEKGRSLRLANPSIQVSFDGEAQGTRRVDAFISWARDPNDSSKELVPLVSFAGTDTMVGQGRFEKFPQWRRKADHFVAHIEVAPRPLDAFKVTVPSLIVEGKTIVVPEVTFTYKTVSYMMKCVQ